MLNDDEYLKTQDIHLELKQTIRLTFSDWLRISRMDKGISDYANVGERMNT